MSLRKLLHVVWQNIARSKKNFVFSSIGIIVGISTFTFFIALSQGIQDRVLNRIFPIDQLEIEPIGGVAAAASEDAEKSDGIGGVLSDKPRVLDAAAVTQLRGIKGVKQAYPKMRARFPAKVETGILDRRMAGEGFIEGLEISDQIRVEMSRHEANCTTAEDVCKRREVSCLKDTECAHEGMECIDGLCKARQYWRSFYDRHARPACTARSDCGDEQVCAYDKWVILKLNKDAGDAKKAMRRISGAAGRIEHEQLDVDLFIAIAKEGTVTDSDIEDAERVDAEIWLVTKTPSTPEAKTLKEHPGRVRHFTDVAAAIAHIEQLSPTLSEGTCAGVPCTVKKAPARHYNNQYFKLFRDHRGNCGGRTYCATRNVLSRKGRCEAYMPVALNPLMVDFYNSNVVSQLGSRPLPNPCMVLGLKGYFRLGYSFLRESMDKVWQRVRWAEIVGYTDKAVHLGGTVPLTYVERYNRFYLGQKSTETFDSILLQIPRNEDVAEVIEQVKKKRFDLSRNSKFARKAGEMLMIITLTFLLISLIIIIISAMNISHTFLMVVFERQREIGIMRAIGASRWDIRLIILVESGFIGLVAGVIGNLLGFGLSRLVNLLADGLRARFPVIPEDFFVYSWMLVGGSVVFALVFCLAGAWVPANRAAKLDPAVVLSQA